MYHTTLRQLHGFFQKHHFYALLLISTLTCGLLFGRAWRIQQIMFSFMIWNLFLAWVPYMASLWAAWIHERLPKARWRLIIPGLLWLLFFPNAPYLITDLIHLRERPPVPIWYDGGLLASFVLSGCFLAVVSLHSMQQLVHQLYGRWMSWLFALGAIACAGIGIYLGRVQRWNSWDIFFAPQHILTDILMIIRHPLDNIHRIALSGVAVIVLVICYVMYLSAYYYGAAKVTATR
jgi:uncharacterized membrane protein